MDNMYERIAELCRLKGVTVTQMCREIGISRSALSELKTGRTQRLSMNYTKKILEYFNVDISVFERPVEDIELLNNDKAKSPSVSDELSDKEKLMLQMFRESSEDLQESFLALWEAALKEKGILQ